MEISPKNRWKRRLMSYIRESRSWSGGGILARFKISYSPYWEYGINLFRFRRIILHVFRMLELFVYLDEWSTGSPEPWLVDLFGGFWTPEVSQGRLLLRRSRPILEFFGKTLESRRCLEESKANFGPEVDVALNPFTGTFTECRHLFKYRGRAWASCVYGRGRLRSLSMELWVLLSLEIVWSGTVKDEPQNVQLLSRLWKI